MSEKIVKKVTEYLVKGGYIRQEDYEIYEYGISISVMMGENIILSLVFSALLGMLPQCAFFYCLYIPLRSYAGGYHAPTIKQCTFISQLIVLVNLYLVKWLSAQAPLIIWVYLIASCTLHLPGIIRQAPQDTENKPLEPEERNKYKKKTMIILAIETICLLLTACLGGYIWAVTVANIYLIQHILLNIKIREKKTNEKA